MLSIYCKLDFPRIEDFILSLFYFVFVLYVSCYGVAVTFWNILKWLFIKYYFLTNSVFFNLLFISLISFIRYVIGRLI